MLPKIKVETWEGLQDFVVTVDGSPVGSTLTTRTEAEKYRDWLNSAYEDLAKHFSKKIAKTSQRPSNDEGLDVIRPDADDHEGCITAGGALEPINVVDDGLLETLFKNHLQQPLADLVKSVELLAYHEGKAEGIQFAILCGKNPKQQG